MNERGILRSKQWECVGMRMSTRQAGSVEEEDINQERSAARVRELLS